MSTRRPRLALRAIRCECSLRLTAFAVRALPARPILLHRAECSS